MLIRVPASSANLGPGFDALGMALTLYAEAAVTTGDEPAAGESVPRGAQPCDAHHPATIAFRRGGGLGTLWLRSPIPVGRGLGFSGAVRVAGLVAAHAQRFGPSHETLSAAGPELLRAAAAIEGHADNVAASLLGGVVATTADRAVRVPLAVDPAIVAWVPTNTTSTDASRAGLPVTVSMADAVFNIGRAAMLVAALAAGEINALREATGDRLHQDHRLAAIAPSRLAMQAALDGGAWCAWLSGSGPTVAAMCAVDEAAALAASLPADGHTKLLRIDHEGATIE